MICRMKRFLLNFVMVASVVFAGVCVTSCSSDDVEEPGSSSELVAQLQGTWRFQQGKETINGSVEGIPINESVSFSRSELESMKSNMESMLGTKVEFWDETLVFEDTMVNGVSYRTSGMKLMGEGLSGGMDGVTFSVTVKSVTSTTLVLTEEFNMGGLRIMAEMHYAKEGK